MAAPACLDCAVAATTAAAPWAQTLRGVGMVSGAIVLELELLGALSRSETLPSVFTRKATHICVGLGTSLLLPSFPAQFWPARLAVTSVLFAFMGIFGWIAEMRQASYARLPGFLRSKVDSMVSNMCRNGARKELAEGTWYYCYIVAIATLLFWTAPVNAILFATLFVGDGVADPVGRSVSAALRPARAEDHALGPLQYRVLNFGVKSVPGSLAFFLSSLGTARLLGRFYANAGHFTKGFDMSKFPRVALLATLAATVAEAASPPGKDNLLVPLAVITVCHYFEHHGTCGLMSSCG